MRSVWVDELTVLILDKPQVVLGHEMPSLLVVTDVGLLRSVGRSADRQVFLYRGQDVDKSITDL